MSEYRIEKDSLGEVRVPANALYGAQTQRAAETMSYHRRDRRTDRGCGGQSAWSTRWAPTEVRQCSHACVIAEITIRPIQGAFHNMQTDPPEFSDTQVVPRTILPDRNPDATANISTDNPIDDIRVWHPSEDDPTTD